ncbi:hypothetical protein B0T24DRAFT_228393 [Lasiosphaeria ovina]|uniref:Uncharacterized protein n=1 Tax=Lasiosphaeria ovina TaxID=92902 RepID=A0AAE0NBQ1_9PEZI|nr:hypothetical protein B0T24DRAFT_228393 [Lasiosphaeria ovina]
MRPTTPNLKIPRSVGPSSPPQTPTTALPLFGGHSLGGHKSHPARPMAPPNPLDPRRPMMSVTSGGRPADRGPNFSHPRPVRPEQLSPRSPTSSIPSSSDSEGDSASPPRSVTSQRAKTAPLAPQARTGRVVTHAAFTVEEMSDFGDSDDERVGVIRPHAIEYAESDRSRSRSRNPPEIDQTIMQHLGNLNCSDESDLSDIDTVEYQDILLKRREQRRHKRMTSGSIGKRTISESIGSDTDREDLKAFLGAEEVGSSARRLRRKTGDRRSLLFQDPPPPRIEELEEPDSSEDEILISETLARELPYYQYISMEIDSPSP